ncbi:hypothetical protein RQP46_010392 [Phenoliferia psychrophenolica]
MRLHLCGGRRERFATSPDAWKICIPAVLYVAQNNLVYAAAGNLDLVTFQVIFSLKVLTSAVVGHFLQRRLSSRRWVSLAILGLGAAIIHSFPFHHSAHEHLDRNKGLAAAALACCLSGVAGPYLEGLLKGTGTDLWTRNLQLSSFSLIPSLIPLFFPSVLLQFAPLADPERSVALFAHFNPWAALVILMQVAGGILASAALVYSDELLKISATACSTLLILGTSVAFFQFLPSPTFLVGTLFILFAVFTYSRSEKIHSPTPSPPCTRRPSLHLPMSTPPRKYVSPTSSRPSSRPISPPTTPPTTSSTSKGFKVFRTPTLPSAEMPITPPATTITFDFGDNTSSLPPSPPQPPTKSSALSTKPRELRIDVQIAELPSYSTYTFADLASTHMNRPLGGTGHARRASRGIEPRTPDVDKVFSFDLSGRDFGAGTGGDCPAWISMGASPALAEGDVRRMI